jgi:hypothetical protein
VVPLLAVEGVKQRAVEHGVKGAVQTVEPQSVGDDELDVESALRGAAACDRDGGLRDVDAEYVQPSSGEVKRVVARPAPGVEHRAFKRARPGQTHDRRLWLSDIPGRRAILV